MWTIKHIFDGEYGCEEVNGKGGSKVLVTLTDEAGNEQTKTVSDEWLTINGLDVGSEWPDYSKVSLETEDLILKKAVFEDWQDIYVNLWSHPESAKNMLWVPTFTEADAKDRMERTIEYQALQKYALFIYEKNTGKAIGFAGMKLIEPGVYEETGIAFGPAFVGKGYGKQVLNALLEAGREEGAKKMIATCRTVNIPSHKMQMSCGFVFSHNEDRVDERNGEAYVLEFNEYIYKSR